jgi:hypothetical protein
MVRRMVVEVVITTDKPDLLKRQGSTEKLTEVHPLDFPFKIWIPDWRSLLTEATGIPRIGWKKRPKVEKHHQGHREREKGNAHTHRGTHMRTSRCAERRIDIRTIGKCTTIESNRAKKPEKIE